MSAFASEAEFFDWFHERYGHYPRDYYDDRGLPYPGDEGQTTVAASTPSQSRRLASVQRLIDQGATEGERAAARAAMQRLTGVAADDHGFADTSGSYDDQGFAA